MKRFSEQFQKQAKKISLSSSEVVDLRERVVAYMEYHPRAEAATAGSAIVQDEFRLLKVSGWRIAQWGGALCGVLLLAVTYVAEQSVPGDSLYAVKVSFNEEVRSTLARSPYEKVVWETERLNRRVAEARLLASEGRLTEEVEAEVVKAVLEHSESARREIEVLKQTDREEAALASIQFETSIAVQSTSLRNNDTASTTEGKSTAMLATALAESSQINEATTEDELPSYDRLMAHIEQETTRAYELLRSVSANATDEEEKDIARRMEDVARLVAAAMEKSGAAELTAREELVQAIQRTQRLIVFMTNIDVRSSVTVEQIVPVTLTLEERIAHASTTAATTLVTLAKVDEALAATTTDVAVSEKLTPALATARETLQSVTAQFGAENFDIVALEIILTEAVAVVADAARILAVSPVDAALPGNVLETEVVQVPATSTASTTIDSVDEGETESPEESVSPISETSASDTEPLI